MIQAKLRGVIPAAQRPFIGPPPLPRRRAAVPARFRRRVMDRDRDVVDTDDRRTGDHRPHRRASDPPVGPPAGVDRPRPRAGRQPPRNELPARPDETGTPGDEFRERRQQLQVVPNGLAESDAGIDVDLAHPRRRASAAAASRPRRPRRRRRRSGVLLHDLRSPVHVHDDEPAPFGGHRGRGLATSFTRVAPRRRAAWATAGFIVSIETRTSPASASTTGRTRRSSSSRDRLGTRPGRLPAHVDDVGALGGHSRPWAIAASWSK